MAFILHLGQQQLIKYARNFVYLFIVTNLQKNFYIALSLSDDQQQIIVPLIARRSKRF